MTVPGIPTIGNPDGIWGESSTLVGEVLNPVTQASNGQTPYSGGLGVNVIEEGAIGDGVVDDTLAIQAAITKAGTYGVVFFPPDKTYRITSTITCILEGQVWLLWGAVISVDFSGGIGIVWGQNGTRTRLVKAYGGKILHASATDWSSGTTGVQFLNCNYCHWTDLTVGLVSTGSGNQGFEKGVDFYAQGGQGTSYCELTQPVIVSCKFGIRMLADGASSFVTENKVFGGRIGYASADPSAVGGFNIYIDRINGANIVNNNNFFGVALEGLAVPAGNPTGAVFNGGAGCGFLYNRYEGAGWTVPFIVEGANAAGQTFGNSYIGGDGLLGPSSVTLTNKRATIMGTNGRYFGGGAAADPILLVLQQASSNTNKALSFAGTTGTEARAIDAIGQELYDLKIATVGKGLFVKEGTNAKQGVATLVAGTVTVANTAVTTSSRIQLTAQDNNTTGALRVSARVGGTSFTITSNNAGDTGVIAYEIFEPA